MGSFYWAGLATHLFESYNGLNSTQNGGHRDLVQKFILYCIYLNVRDLGLNPILWGEENPSSVCVNQYNADGTTLIKQWGCITDVERELKIPHSNISKVCRGKRKTAGGYFWEYEFQ